MSADGPELLCAETARRIMGWIAADIPWAYDGTTPVWHTSAGDPVMTVFSWRPDRDDTQNMQVFDRMVDLGFDLTLTVGGGRTVVQVDRDDRGGRGGRAATPTARGEHADRRIALLRAALAGVDGADG